MRYWHDSATLAPDTDPTNLIFQAARKALMRTAIFLDVDGVLNGHDTKEKIRGMRAVDKGKVGLLREITKIFPGNIVLISSWKDEPPGSDFANNLKDSLAEQSLMIAGRTAESCWEQRAEGIRAYIREHDIEDFIILDDEEFPGYRDPDLYPHWICTAEEDPITGLIEDGLQEKHIKVVKQYAERGKYAV